VKVSSSEGVANHTVPESCAGTREGFGEALTGVRIGWVLARCRLRDDTGPEDQECQNAGGRGEDG
jgi:hypothetical protein